MSTINSLEDLLTAEIKDLYNEETQLVKALPKLAMVSSYAELVDAFELHLEEMKMHVERLQQFGELLQITSAGETRKPSEGEETNRGLALVNAA